MSAPSGCCARRRLGAQQSVVAVISTSRMAECRVVQEVRVLPARKKTLTMAPDNGGQQYARRSLALTGEENASGNLATTN
jgi:hypothetical protein